ncbi:MAG: transcription termination factor NusA [Clostridia bacterium]|nr:transcription termination factor NusA [Clostridia bacterium]
MVNREFFAALEELEKEKGITQDAFIEALEAALNSAVKKQADLFGLVKIKTDEEAGTIEFVTEATVVDEVTDKDSEILLEDAKKLKRGVKVGDVITEKFVPRNFSRIAAQTAKQVIQQKIRETEKEAAVNEFSDKKGQLLVGTVRRVDGQNILIDFGKGQVEGIMLPSDQVKGETYSVNDRIKVYVKNIKSGYRGAQVLVSRSAPGLVEKLFEEEVPEIKQGTVEVKSISREPGERTKMAIASTDERIDAVGACVGNKGSRVNAVVAELGGEKIDIIPWSENPLEFIAKALSPAKVLYVKQTDEKTAMAVVPDDKLSLAIGKNGQNARLAVRLTGWKIDVKSESAAMEMGVSPDDEDESEE